MSGAEGAEEAYRNPEEIAETLRRQAEEIRLLTEAGRLLGSTLDPERIYDAMHSLVTGVMDCISLIVSTYDPETSQIRCAFAWIEGRRMDAAQFPPVPLAPEGSGMQSAVIRTGEPLSIPDVDERLKTSK